MNHFIIFGILILSVVLVTNYDSVLATHISTHQDDSMEQHEMMNENMKSQHHIPHNGICAPGFTSLGQICVLDDRCGPGVYAGKVCVMDGMMKQYLKPHHQKFAGISVDNIICVEGKHLMFKHHDSSPACVNSHSVEKLKQRGWQTEKPVMACTMEYDPVCGMDAMTYGNVCSLDTQHMAMKHQGECMKPSIQTTILYIDSKLVDCVGVGPQQCMLIQENPDSKWQMFYDSIEGFDYQEGIQYKLSVMITEIENPPADGSSLKYTLIEVLEP